MSIISTDIHPQNDKIKVEFEDFGNFRTCRVYSHSETPGQSFSFRFYVNSMHDVVRIKNGVLWAFEQFMRKQNEHNNR